MYRLQLLLLLCTTCVRASPVVSRTRSTCTKSSLECREEASTRCLKVSDLCNGIPDCSTNQDELNCDGFPNVSSQVSLISTQSMDNDTVIDDISQEACAKLCIEENQFHCTAVQYQQQSGRCKLLDANLTSLSNSSITAGSWGTTLHRRGDLTRSPGGLKFDTAKTALQSNAVRDDPKIISARKDRQKRQTKTGTIPKSAHSCGKRSVEFDPPKPAAARVGRVVNGVEAPVGAYPWQVAIKVKDGPGAFIQRCGGAIINNRFVLTAAHCVDEFHRKGRAFVVVVGEHSLKTPSPKEQLFEVENFVTHPTYRSSKSGGDIALIKLDDKVGGGKGIVFDDVAQPICLPSSETAYQPGNMCSVSGWGLQKAGDKESVSDILKVVTVPLLSGETCIAKEVYGNYLNSNNFPDSMVCAGYLEEDRADACSGDSGGPLACRVNGEFQLLGLVSWGDVVPGGCANKNKPGVYTKTLHYLDWIQTQMGKL